MANSCYSQYSEQSWESDSVSPGWVVFLGWVSGLQTVSCSVLPGSPWAVRGTQTPASHRDTCAEETQIQEGWIVACIFM